MDTNTSFKLFIILPAILMFIISVGMPFYCLHVLKSAGEKKIPLVHKKQVISKVIAPVLCYLLVLLPYFIPMGKFGRIIPLCGVAGLFIVLKEMTFVPKSGVYEKLLINGSVILRYKDIEKLPEEAQGNILVITTKTHHNLQLVFDNSNEAEEVLAYLKASISVR